MGIEVLVAEDDPSWKNFYKLLKSEHVNVTIEDNLKSAIRSAQTKDFDMYITSGCYPACLGAVITPGICYVFYHRIIEMKPDAQVFLVAGHDHGLSYMDASPLKMTYIPKKDAHKIIPGFIRTLQGKKAEKQ